MRLVITEDEIKGFWVRVEKTKTCWIWKGGKFKFGHGNIWIGADKRAHYAHRVSFFLNHGYLPEPPNCILHNCPEGDNPACVNPDHLWVGTRDDNNKDKMHKGRCASPRGEDAGQALVTEKQAIEIIRLYGEGRHTQKELGHLFGITQSAVSCILIGKNWAHLERPEHKRKRVDDRTKRKIMNQTMKEKYLKGLEEAKQ